MSQFVRIIRGWAKRMNRVGLGMVLLSVLSVLSGCGGGETVQFKETTPVQLAPKSFEQVMFTYTIPQKPFARVGVLRTNGFDHPDGAQKAMREKAAALGVDGIAHAHCGSGTVDNPFWGAMATALVNIGRTGDCIGMAFVWRQQ